MLSDNTKSHLQLHWIVFLWGFTAILGRLITLDALPLVWFRMLFAVIFIFIYTKIKKISLKLSKKILLKFLVAGLIIALHWFTFFRAIKVSNVSITLACLSTGAFFTSIIEPIFYKKKVIWYEIFFGLIVVFGLTIIFNVEGKYKEGILLALISAFLSASFAVINSTFVKDHKPTIISFYELLGGVLFFTIFILGTSGFDSNFFQITSNDFMYLMILSSICTAYAFITSTSVMKFLSPYTVMLTINLEPIYGIALAIIIFKDKEQMSPAFYVGAAVILITVILNGIIKSRHKAS
ncbi:DMT family transporter [Flavobacterium sp.]|uniref:DMT family transporter n=1 Tax=Flavobacterium sp. TaxID=239 RepID=UPI003BCEEE63